MKRKLFTFLLALAASVGTMFAWDYWQVQVGDLYYNLNATDQTAEVTYELKWDENNYQGLTTANIPASVTYNGTTYSVTSIGEWAFRSCSSLTSVAIPNSVTSIGKSAFYGCSNLTSVTIPNSVTSIRESAFWSCSSLASVTIPESVTSIGSYAFEACSSLTSVTIPNSVTSIGDWAFSSCSSLTSVAIPNSVTSIGESAFHGCSNLTSVTIPNSVTSIGESAFWSCSSLASVTIPESVTSIGSYAFEDCSSLTSVTIPNSVTSIGDRAFSSCSSLTSVTIPNSVTSIGEYAFSGCSSLTSVTIGNSVTSIGYGAFLGCSSLASVTIGNSVTSIGGSAFSGCSGLTSVVWNAKNCSDFSSAPFTSAVTSFTFGNEVEHLPAYLCSGMSNLTSVTIPNSVTSIGGSAFNRCYGLEVVYITNLTAWCGIEFGSANANPLYYAHNLRLNNSKLTNLVIPDGVTRINNYAFAGGTGLTVVTIPESVTSIGKDAFYDCSNLVAARCSSLESWCGIEFGSAEANPIYYVHSLTVNGSSITDLVIPESVINIKSYAFVNCQKLASVTIGDGVTSIGGAAFYNCSKLNTINIPASVTSIGDYAFYNCYQLKEVYINDIGAWCTLAFGSNEANPLYTSNYNSILYLDSAKLTELVVPEGIENISSYRFDRCTDLTSVTLPESFSSFESSAFNGCYNIQRLTLNAFAPPTGGPNSGITNTQCNLYVPEESLDIYANAYWWEDFANIRAIGTARFVDFVDWDKTVLSAQDILVGESAVAPEDPTREGHTFTGWDKDYSNITEDLTITALYKINKYRVEFVDWDGTLIKVDSVEYQSAATAPEDPTREGYTFSNWNKSFDNITGNLTVTAQYEFTPVTIYYYNPNDNYKYAVYSSIWYYYWMTPVEGYEGWYQITITNDAYRYTFYTYESSAENPYDYSYVTYTNAPYFDGENVYCVDGKWWQNSFDTRRRVEFVDWDGTLLKVDSVEYMSEATAPEAPTREGYTFTGWDKNFNKVTGDMTVTAQYGLTIYYYNPDDSYKYAAYVYNYETGNEEWYYWMTPVEGHEGWYQIAITGYSSYYIEVSFYAFDLSQGSPNWSSYRKYTFAGEYDGVNAYYVNNQGWQDSFNIGRYKVDFLDWDGSILKTDSVNYFASAVAPANPRRTGYNFIGWDKDFSRITEDLVVTAQYEMGENTDFTIYFVNGNDKSEIYVHDVVLRIPAAPEIEGFTFLGWRPVAEFIDSNTLEIEAVYEADEALSAPSIYTNPANPAQKLIRDGNVYVLKGEKVYTVTGQKVK